jgi:hypothetical protein
VDEHRSEATNVVMAKCDLVRLGTSQMLPHQIANCQFGEVPAERVRRTLGWRGLCRVGPPVTFGTWMSQVRILSHADHFTT